MTAFAAHPVVCDNSYMRAHLSLSFCSFHSSCPTLSTLNHACSAHRLISSFGYCPSHVLTNWEAFLMQRQAQSSIDEVIVKFAQITPQERAKRFLFESLGTEKYFQEVGPFTYQNFWAQGPK